MDTDFIASLCAAVMMSQLPVVVTWIISKSSPSPRWGESRGEVSKLFNHETHENQSPRENAWNVKVLTANLR